MKTHQLFITPVCSQFLDFDTKPYIKRIYEEEKKHKGRFRSNTGFQTGDCKYDDYKDLFEIIKPHTIEYFKKFEFDAELYLTNFWFNINRYKDVNVLHHHPQSAISGVLYFQVPKDSGNIIFENPNWHIDYTWSSERIRNFNDYNMQSYYIQSADKLLLLFPSYLRHYVKPNMSKEDRICMSFNLGVRWQVTNNITN